MYTTNEFNAVIVSVSIDALWTNVVTDKGVYKTKARNNEIKKKVIDLIGKHVIMTTRVRNTDSVEFYFDAKEA